MSVKQGGTPSNRARIRRGPSAPRKRVTSTPARNPRNLPVRQSSASRALAVIPAPMQARIRRGGNYALGFLMIGLVVAGVVAMRLPQMIGIELGEAIGRAGFAVNRIEIRGISKMDRARVYDVALEQQSRAMPLVDHPRPAVALWLDRRCARFAPPAGHAGGRCGRAQAGGNLAISA
jgi:cell division protein FtsQ